MTEIFEAATRQKLRLETTRGVLSIEDLWDLPLRSTRSVSLDDIALELHSELKEPVSFVDQAAAADQVLQLKFDVVKHIIDVKLAEKDSAQKAAERQEAKQKLLAALDRKRDQRLETLSEEELKAELAKL